MQETISKIITEAHGKVYKILAKKFPSLVFYISPNGKLSAWVAVNNNSREAIPIQKPNVYAGNVHTTVNWEYLEELNEKVSLISDNPDKYFMCSECGEIKSMERDFKDNVFAGYYCKDCAKKPSIASLIEESHKRGFYD